MDDKKLLEVILELATNIVLLEQQGMIHDNIFDVKLDFLIKAENVIIHDTFESEEQIQDLQNLINNVILYE